MRLFCCTFILLLGVPAQIFAAADLVIINANVRTLGSAQPKAEAIAIVGNEIVAVGSNKTISALAGQGTKTIDARGRLVLPGFNDAHVHFAAIGNIFSSINLREVKTPKEMAERVANYVRFLPRNRWILGSGWDNRNWVPNDPPTREMVDPVTPYHPVFIYNVDGKAALANSRAFVMAGINKLTKDPPGGQIMRDAAGEPTGVLRGSATRLVSSIVPLNHTKSWPEIAETASNYAASLGVTSVQDMHSDDLADIYRELARQGKLKTRIYDCAPLSNLARLAASGTKAASGDAMVRTGCVKYFSEDEDESIPELQRDISAADKAGLQVMIHAIGNRANEIVLDVFENAAKENGPRDRRFRIEHAQNARKEDIPRFGRSKIIASMQPWLFVGEGGSAAEDYKRLLELNTPLAFGSDASITDFNPLFGIYAAVTGKGSISVEQAVRAYTIGSAYAEFQENVKGTIEVGKLADLVILSDDIFKIDKVKIKDVFIVTTIVDGKEAYQAK